MILESRQQPVLTRWQKGRGHGGGYFARMHVGKYTAELRLPLAIIHAGGETLARMMQAELHFAIRHIEALQMIERGERPLTGVYDMNGRPISMRKWNDLLHAKKRILAQEHVGEFWVSTVLIGLDHGFMSSRPIIFESMVFDHGHSHWYRGSGPFHPDVRMERYSTKEEARAGHARLVEWCRNGGALFARVANLDEQIALPAPPNTE